MPGRKLVLTKEGEKKFLEMFNVSSDNYISKQQLKMTVLEMAYQIDKLKMACAEMADQIDKLKMACAEMADQIDKLKMACADLTFKLFCENPLHSHFNKFSTGDLNIFRTLKFGGKPQENKNETD